jgi:hypothetical protein
MFKKKPVEKMKLGMAIDTLYTTRQNRLVEQGTIKEMQAYETELKDYLIENLPKEQASGVAGSLARAAVVTKKIPVVEDWDALYKYIKKKNAFDLLNRALNTAACTERLENGEKVPGIGSFTAVTVSVNKL